MFAVQVPPGTRLSREHRPDLGRLSWRRSDAQTRRLPGRWEGARQRLGDGRLLGRNAPRPLPVTGAQKGGRLLGEWLRPRHLPSLPCAVSRQLLILPPARQPELGSSHRRGDSRHDPVKRPQCPAVSVRLSHDNGRYVTIRYSCYFICLLRWNREGPWSPLFILNICLFVIETSSGHCCGSRGWSPGPSSCRDPTWSSLGGPVSRRGQSGDDSGDDSGGLQGPVRKETVAARLPPPCSVFTTLGWS